MIETKPEWSPLHELAREHLVVVVDDDHETLSALHRALGREPYEVVTTDHPETVLGWLSAKDVSLVISDQRMPGMDGTRFLDEVWKRSPTTAGILLTGYPESTFTTPEFRTRLQCLISKPWNDELLKRAIRRLLHERETSDPGTA